MSFVLIVSRPDLHLEHFPRFLIPRQKCVDLHVLVVLALCWAGVALVSSVVVNWVGVLEESFGDVMIIDKIVGGI